MTSFYSAKIWQEGKRGPPPIFASIGVRHPFQIQLDIALREQETLPSLFDLIGQEIEHFDAGNTVIAVAQIPKVSQDQSLEVFRENRAWQELQRRMHSSVARLEPRGLSMLAYALARMKGFEDPVLLTAVLDRSVTKMPDFGPTDAAKLAWVLAKLQIRERSDLWVALSKEAARKICDSGRFIDISMTAWAFAKAGQAERILFGQLASAALQCNDLPPHTIANLCWAFAKSKNSNKDLFDMLAKRSIEAHRSFDRQS
ncbi:Casein kinase I, partial [Durusdinium trenchii]